MKCNFNRHLVSSLVVSSIVILVSFTELLLPTSKQCLAAINSHKHAFKKKSKSGHPKIHAEYNSSKKKMLRLQNKLSILEKELEQKNQQYMQQLEKIKQLDNDITTFNNVVIENNNDLNRKRQEYQQTTHRYLSVTLPSDLNEESVNGASNLNKQIEDENEEMENLIRKQILKSKLVAELQDINQNQMKNDALKKELEVMKERLFEYSAVTENLSKLLLEMETQKNLLTESYLQKSDPLSKNIKESTNNTTHNTAANSSLNAALLNAGTSINLFEKNFTASSSTTPIHFEEFQYPINQYSNIKLEKKGVLFKCKDITPVMAIGKGKVVYSGTLSAYGNIIIVDHGQDIRSILLGQFKPKLEKEDQVEKGDIIGYTLPDNGNLGQVYFEIRKKDTTQNIMSWFNKNNNNKNSNT